MSPSSSSRFIRNDGKKHQPSNQAGFKHTKVIWKSRPPRSRNNMLLSEVEMWFLMPFVDFLGERGKIMQTLDPTITMLGFPLRDFHQNQAWFWPEIKSRQLRCQRYPLSGCIFSCARELKIVTILAMKMLLKSWTIEYLEAPNKQLYVRWKI